MPISRDTLLAIEQAAVRSWPALETADIEDTLAAAHSALDWLDRMRKIVQQRQRKNQDNYSAIAVWVGNPAEITRIEPPR